MGGQFAPKSVDTTRFDPRKRWRKVQELITRVWSRWLKEYLPMLNTRPKWTEVVKDLVDGDVVLVLDPNLPRGQWPLGRITETFPGRDGHTRVAKVQCGDCGQSNTQIGSTLVNEQLELLQSNRKI